MEEEKNTDESVIKDETDSVINDGKIEEDITREINLDELYDGAVNNTVIIDPVTKNEVLIKTRKSGGKILLVLLLIIVLLILYFVTNKLPIHNKKANVKPNVTTTTTKAATISKKGVLSCTYLSESSSEKQSATYKANYEDENIIDSEFNYVVNLLSESSEIYDDLQKQYENFFISNGAISGIEFNKDEKSFNFKFKTIYKDLDVSKYTIAEGQTLLYALPTNEDTLEKVRDIYTNKGYSCSLTEAGEN